MAVKKTGSKQNDEHLPLVSFKIDHELFQVLKELSQKQNEETGIDLSPSLIAKGILVKALAANTRKKRG